MLEFVHFSCSSLLEYRHFIFISFLIAKMEKLIEPRISDIIFNHLDALQTNPTAKSDIHFDVVLQITKVQQFTNQKHTVYEVADTNVVYPGLVITDDAQNAFLTKSNKMAVSFQENDLINVNIRTHVRHFVFNLFTFHLIPFLIAFSFRIFYQVNGEIIALVATDISSHERCSRKVTNRSTLVDAKWYFERAKERRVSFHCITLKKY